MHFVPLTELHVCNSSPYSNWHDALTPSADFQTGRGFLARLKSKSVINCEVSGSQYDTNLLLLATCSK